MKKFCGLSVFVFIVLAFASSAFAVPASPFPTKFKQPDGSVATIYQRGDEFDHWTETTGGYHVVKNESSGYLEFAQGGASKGGVVYRDGTAAPAGAQKYVAAPSASRASARVSPLNKARWNPRPLSGTRKILAIRVQFSDRTFSTDIIPAVSHDEYFFGEDNSVAKYFSDQSHGRLEVKSALNSVPANVSADQCVTVTLSTPHPDRAIARDQISQFTRLANEVVFVTNTIEATNIDLAPFDTNNDGTITPDELCVYLIVAGYEESGSPTQFPAVWAHAWDSWVAGGSQYVVTVSEKVLSAWAMNGELYGDDPQGFAVIAHELGHQFCKLPDLYDVGSEYRRAGLTNSGLGAFSIMAGGSWGAKSGDVGGSMPVNFDAWSRQYLGWETPQMTKSGNVTLTTPTIGTGSGSVKLYGQNHRSSEYFLAEVRDFSGWDKGLEKLLGSDDVDFPDGGILIQHIDDEIGSGNLDAGNDINDSSVVAHQGVMAVEADGPHMTKAEDEGSIYTLWWAGNPNAKSPEKFDTPNSDFYGAVKSGIKITGIGKPEDGKVTVVVQGGTPSASPTPTPTPTTGGSGCNAAPLSIVALFALMPLVFKRKK